MTTLTTPTPILTDELLATLDERQAIYDRENRFFQEDFDDLKRAGYLDLVLPTELGGRGASLDEFVACQRRLASVAPATAVALNMHLYWVGLAADMARMGDDRARFILEAAADGKVLAAGHGERGNDIPVLLSTSSAERVDGGWRITGHKIFGSLTPVWDYLGFHAMDSSDPEAPKIIHGFLSRNAERYHIDETWDTLGMRATASHDTIIEGAFVPDEQTMVVCPAGFAGADFYHIALFAWALFGFSGVYLGIAERAYQEVVSGLSGKSVIAMERPMSHHPEAQHRVAQMRMKLESAAALTERMCQDWVNGVDHGHDWVVKILGTKHTVASLAWEVVDIAMDLTGGAGLFKKNRIEQLFRDARLGRMHPGNPMFTHEVVGKLSLGIDPDAQPRWG